MSTLAITITRQVAEQMSQALLTLAARQADIATAESVAQRLSSAGVPAEANGRADGCAIHVWVKVGPVNPLRLEAALTRLDLRITDQYPGHTDYTLRIAGIDVPLYVTASTAPFESPEK